MSGVFISGPPKQCGNPLCAGLDAPTIVHELWDALSRCVVGEANCRGCEAVHVYTRRALKTEPSASWRHHQAIYPTPVDQDGPRQAIQDMVDPQPPPVSPKGQNLMRFIDRDKVGVYLDMYAPRLEKTSDSETKVFDLTCRIQPLTPELAAAVDSELKAALFALTTGDPKPKVKTLEWKNPSEHQDVQVFAVPDVDHPQLAFIDCEVDPVVRARTEKGVDGYALVFYLTVGPLGPDEQAALSEWYTQQRFLSFNHSQAVMNFDAKAEDKTEAQPPRHRRTNGKDTTDEAHA